MGKTFNTGYLRNIIAYDASDNITLPARLAVTSTVAINNTTPYDTTQFSLDVNGGLLVKNVGKTAQFVLINSNPASGGNAGFVVHTVGGTSATSFADIQGYYGTSIAGSTVLRLNPQGGNVLVGSLAGSGTRIVVADATGVLSTQAAQTLNDLNGVPTSRTITINGTTFDLTANRSFTINSMVYPGAGIAVSTGSAWGSSLTDNSSNWNTAFGWGNHASAGYATTTYVNTQVANLVASAPATLDTLNELAAALGNDAAFSTTVSTALGNRLRVDINTQGLSATLQGYGRTNLGLGTAATSNTGDFAAASHTHSIANVTGLQTALDGKQASLGFTPYNSTNPSGYISSYTETDTLASVTGRGASTSTNSIFSGGLQSRRNQTDNNYTTAALWTESFGNTTTGIAFHISGVVGKFLEMRTNGTLYWENSQVWTSGTLTNLNQLTNGPGYITSYTETDTLASVTSRGASTTAAITINRNVVGLVFNRDAVTNYNGIYYSTAGSPRWFIGMRENLSSNNHIHYSEQISQDILTLNVANGNATIYGNLAIGNSAEVLGLIQMGSGGRYGMGVSGAYTNVYSHNSGSGVRLGYYDGTTFTARITVPNGGAPTIDSNVIFHAGNYTSYTDGRYWVSNGSWFGDLGSYSFSRLFGNESSGGGFAIMTNPNNGGQTSILIDGSYFAGEQGGFYSLNSSNQYASRVGFYNNSGIANFNADVSTPGNVYATAAAGRVSAGSTSIDGMLFDSSRAAIIARGNYPHIELWSDISNSNHGGTLRFGGYDNGSSGAYKSWNIGTPGSDLYFLDIGYGGYNSNPHAGIAGLGASYGYPGAFTMMRFHNNGNVGIGNFGTYGSGDNTPAYKLDIRGDVRATNAVFTNDGSSRVMYLRGSGNIIQFQDGNSVNKWEVVGREGTFYIYKNDGTGSGYRYQINSSGDHTITGYITANSGITTSSSFNASTYNQPAIRVNASGTSSAGAAFAIQQITGEGWTGIFVDFEPYTGWGLYHDNPNNYFCVTAEASTGSLRSFTVPSRESGNRTAHEKIRFDQGNGSILAGGDITAFSDGRVKTDIKVIDNAIDKIKAIRGVTFLRTDSEGDAKNIKQAGVIAQEVLAVLPEVVHQDHNTGMYSVAYGNMAGLFIEAIKEQQNQIESQKSEIEELKDLVKQLINR